ncbi:MAG: CoA transferase, partial [Pseudomonadota bacterium]
RCRSAARRDDTQRCPAIKSHADLIMVALLGDRAGRPQVDYTVNPALGIPDITGPEGSTEPVANALPAWDLIAGHLCVSSLLAAERHRLRTGQGQDVQLTLKDVAAATLGHLGMVGDAVLNDAPRQKAGNALYGAYGQDFVCADGKRVMVIGLTGRQWSGLLKVTGLGSEMEALGNRLGLNLRDEGVRWEVRHEITNVFADWFARRRVAEFEGAFNGAGVTWSQFRTIKEAVAQDPDLSPQNPMFTTLHQPGLGTFPVPGHAADFSAIERQAPKGAPQLGTHTEEILSEVTGLDDGEIARLFDKGIVRGAHVLDSAA